jgi:thiosulfate dehydrogenase
MAAARLRIAVLACLVAALAGAAIAQSLATPDLDSLPDDAHGRLVREGRALVVETALRIGPGAADPAKRLAGNNLDCQSCHLDGGTQKFGLALVGVARDFPQYRAREGRVVTLEDRINGCMTRSMNGRALANDSQEMRAFVAYIAFLSAGPKQEGRGAGAMRELDRPADPDRGAVVYQQVCASCHGADGQGKRRVGASGAGESPAYEAPPLWGADSFNDGAGMNRLTSAANFIHSNMPRGTTWDSPVLPVADAWDVAAFLVSRERPRKADLDGDFPDRLQKPVDAAYPPFADGFPAEQHRFGPFAPIRNKIRNLMNEASDGN